MKKFYTTCRFFSPLRIASVSGGSYNSIRSLHIIARREQQRQLRRIIQLHPLASPDCTSPSPRRAPSPASASLHRTNLRLPRLSIVQRRRRLAANESACDTTPASPRADPRAPRPNSASTARNVSTPPDQEYPPDSTQTPQTRPFRPSFTAFAISGSSWSAKYRNGVDAANSSP